MGSNADNIFIVEITKTGVVMETIKRKRGGQPVGEENFMKMINFRLKPVEIQMLKDEAARQGISYSVLIRNAIYPIINPDDE